MRNEVVKKTVYDRLVAKVNNIDTNNFVLKTKYDTDKTQLENKLLTLMVLLKKYCYTKITEIENKIPDISNLATKAALTAVVNETASVSNLVKKKTDYNTTIYIYSN